MAEEWIGLGLVPEKPTAAPGGKAEATAVIRNLSAVVDQYLLSVDGLEPSWYTISEPSVSLFPGDKASVQVVIHPPENAVAGAHPFTLRAVSSTDASRQASVAGSVDVGQVGGYEASLSPERASGRKADYQLTVRNHGNTAINLALEGRDDEGALQYRLSRSEVEVPPAGQVEVGVQVAPLSGRLRGPATQHRFRVVAWPAGEALVEAEAVAAAGEFEYKPLIGALPVVPRWPVYAAVALIPLLIGLWLWLQPVISGQQAPQPTPTQPAVAGVPTPTAPATKPAGAPTPTQPAAATKPAGAAATQAPTIVNLSAEPAPGGDGVNIHWEVTGAEIVQLNGENVGPAGTKKVPAQEELFELVAKSPDGAEAKRRLSLVVLKPPQVVSFTAEPKVVQPGKPLTLRWEVAQATRATIEGQEVPVPRGERQVTPEGSRDYVIVAENPVGWVVGRVSVAVQP